MAELRFHSGDKNALAVNIAERVIDVEFNPGEQTTFTAMMWELVEMVKATNYFRLEDITEFAQDFTRNNSLWDKRGKWIGKYARSFKHEHLSHPKS